MKMHKYTEEQKAFMIDFVPGHSHVEIMEAFNARFNGGLTLGRVKSHIANNRLNTGRTGRFVKGQTPPNKGEKMAEAIYERCRPTMFKKGSKPCTRLPIGTEVLLADGYVWVKVDDKPKAPKKVNWTQKHRLIWESVNGTIPEGYIVLFADQDHNNFDLDNLILVSRAQLVRMNQNGLIYDNAEATRTGALIADLISKTTEAKKRVERRRP